MAMYQVSMSGGSSGDAEIGINLDSTSATPGGMIPYFSIGTNTGAAPAAYSGMPGLGWHYLQGMERQATTTTAASFISNTVGARGGITAMLRG